MKTKIIYVIAITAFIALTVSSDSWAIKKCQDKDGKWHYGDVAVEACRTSKVTTLNERGVVTNERPAPLTEEEIAAQAKAKEEADKRAEQERIEREERTRILSIYETEEDIVRQRDNQLYSVQSNIDVHKAYIKSLQEREGREKATLAELTHPVAQERASANIKTTQAEIKSYTKQLAELEQQKIEITDRFREEVEMYRELRKAKQ